MAASELAFPVYGTPTPQGSKKGIHHRSTGRVIVIEQQSTRIRTWRAAVKAAAVDAMNSYEGTGDPFATIGGPVRILIVFQLARSKTHFGTGRNAKTLRDNAPRYPARMPDLDKLARSTFDALTEACVFADDGQIVMADVSKVYTVGGPGAFIRVTDLEALHAQTHRAIETVEVQGALL